MAKSPFSEYLTEMLSRRGAMAQLSAQSGVNHPQISKIAAGDVLPSPVQLAKLIKPMIEADKAFLVREYLLLHLPENAPMVKVIVNDEDGPRDRLQRAIDALDPVTRDSLAVLVEAVNRAPEQGSRALQAVGMWFQSSPAPLSPPEDSSNGSGGAAPKPQRGGGSGAKKDLSLAAEPEVSYGGEAGEGEDGDEVEAAQRAAARAFLKKSAEGGGDEPPAPGTGSAYPKKGTRAVGHGDNLGGN